jgi:molybdenum cofactor cytidylyltransferase
VKHELLGFAVQILNYQVSRVRNAASVTRACKLRRVTKLLTTIQPVVFAAGASSRMGDHKLLLPLAGEPIVRRSVNQLLEAGFSSVTVVLGREPDRVKLALEDLPCEFALNKNYLSGMESSFRAAIDSFSSEVTAALFTLADQVFLSSLEYQKVLEVYQTENPLIAASRFGEVIAPPHIFSSELFPVLGLPGRGAKPLIQANLKRVQFVDHARELLFDVDTPEDYAQAQKTLS